MHKVLVPPEYWLVKFKKSHYQEGAGHYAFYCWELNERVKQMIESMGGRFESPEPFEFNTATAGGAAVFNNP